MLALLLLLGLAAGCASSGEGSSDRSTGILTAEQITEVNANHLHEVIQRLRPTWLRSRGARSVNLDTQIVVATDGSYFGEVDMLRQLAPDNVREIRYIPGSEAASRVRGLRSSVHVEAAIMVQLRDP